MNNSPLDPRLTSYALGELEGRDKEEMEQLIARSPEARAHVESMQRLAGNLRFELRGTPPPSGWKLPLIGVSAIIALLVWGLYPTGKLISPQNESRWAKILLNPPATTNSELLPPETSRIRVNLRGTDAKFSANINAGEVRGMIQAKAREFRLCYEAELARSPGAAGKLTLSYHTEGMWKASESGGYSRDIIDCINRQLKSLPMINGKAEVYYPIEFSLTNP